ncbi:MAG TPA: UxaA family hydrolase [Opitutus sp.]|nr:UxaA family hydrolase [Opitutus sp.]
MTPRAFRVHPSDNVATLVDDAPASSALALLGASDHSAPLVSLEAIARTHKIAVADLAPGAAILKFGVRIGHATRPIARGAWVHLHNLASDLDERSGTLDLHTGAPTDTSSAYV